MLKWKEGGRTFKFVFTWKSFLDSYYFCHLLLNSFHFCLIKIPSFYSEIYPHVVDNVKFLPSGLLKEKGK